MGRRIAGAVLLLALAGGGTAEAQLGRAPDWYTIANAASRNETAEVEQLVNDGSGRNPDAIDSSSGRTALDFAASFDNVEMAKFLLTHGAHADARDRLGNTALHWAAARGSLRAMQVLVDAKADLDAQNRQGQTPLMLAAAEGPPAAVRFLIAKGADPKKTDYSGRDAFQWAEGKPVAQQALSAAR